MEFPLFPSNVYKSFLSTIPLLHLFLSFPKTHIFFYLYLPKLNLPITITFFVSYKNFRRPVRVNLADF